MTNDQAAKLRPEGGFDDDYWETASRIRWFRDKARFKRTIEEQIEPESRENGLDPKLLRDCVDFQDWHFSKKDQSQAAPGQEPPEESLVSHLDALRRFVEDAEDRINYWKRRADYAKIEADNLREKLSILNAVEPSTKYQDYGRKFGEIVNAKKQKT